MPVDPAEPLTVGVLQELLAAGRNETLRHVDEKLADLRALILDGFPAGDTRGHREAHEGVIKAAQDRANLWKSVREKLVTSAVYAVAILVGTALWQHFMSLIVAAGSAK